MRAIFVYENRNSLNEAMVNNFHGTCQCNDHETNVKDEEGAHSIVIVMNSIHKAVHKLREDSYLVPSNT